VTAKWRRCWRHQPPMFDTEDGKPVFRCPKCLHTWPRLAAGDGTFRPELRHAQAKAAERERQEAWWRRVQRRRA
jgi:hypothetical protein